MPPLSRTGKPGGRQWGRGPGRGWGRARGRARGRRTVAYSLQWEAGAAAVALVVWLPVFVGVMALTLSAGHLFVARLRVQTAVDMAALAAVQDVDLERLARGERHIREDQARADAVRWLVENLEAAFPGNPASPARIEVDVYNPSPTRPAVHRRSGRVIRDPTVSVYVEYPARVPSLPAVGGRVLLKAWGDASVIEKQGE